MTSYPLCHLGLLSTQLQGPSFRAGPFLPLLLLLLFVNGGFAEKCWPTYPAAIRKLILHTCPCQPSPIRPVGPPTHRPIAPFPFGFPQSDQIVTCVGPRWRPLWAVRHVLIGVMYTRTGIRSGFPHRTVVWVGYICGYGWLVDARKTNAKIFTHSSYFMHMSSESKFMLITIIKTQRGKKKRTRKTS